MNSSEIIGIKSNRFITIQARTYNISRLEWIEFFPAVGSIYLGKDQYVLGDKAGHEWNYALKIGNSIFKGTATDKERHEILNFLN